ncbi:hypothetical protein L1887_54240 [Cichorium endivia]|nr:hypothetical protein L1887_54240 [Cichorium endivia]
MQVTVYALTKLRERCDVLSLTRRGRKRQDEWNLRFHPPHAAHRSSAFSASARYASTTPSTVFSPQPCRQLDQPLPPRFTRRTVGAQSGSSIVHSRAMLPSFPVCHANHANKNSTPSQQR